MSNTLVGSIITKAAATMGIALPPAAAQMFEQYCDFLMQRNEHVNLTAITNTEDIARFHFLDSLALLNAAHFKNAKVLDIGSGAGFPGVVLKIAEPSIELTLLDATNKRIVFLKDLCQILGFDATFVHARAEEASHHSHSLKQELPSMREQYDIVVSRAVAQLNALCELCLPYVRIGGTFLAMKSVASDDELHEAMNAITLLGAEVIKTSQYTIPDTSVRHRIIIIRKVSKTPDKYPRRFARIEKKPL